MFYNKVTRIFKREGEKEGGKKKGRKEGKEGRSLKEEGLSHPSPKLQKLP